VFALTGIIFAAVYITVRPTPPPVRQFVQLPDQAASGPPNNPAPSPSALAPVPPAPSVPADAWVSWALLTPDGATRTGGDPGVTSTESMIKVGIAADFLHGVEEAGRDPSPHELDLLTRMIRDSDDAAAQELYLARGGDALTRRLIEGCELHNTTITTGWWSKTTISAADAARLGTCVQLGYLVSRRWADWILDQMRHVVGEGRFGIVETHPTDQGTPVAVKNGWTLREDGRWHVNCLAVTGRWTLAVLTRYPDGRGLGYGAGICRQVAATLLPPQRTNNRNRYR
jgi:hypothetical protein